MLSNADNELLCRVGPGTPMGDVLRQYWLPALHSQELPQPDGDPVRLRLLSEDLIAFRNSSGNVGVIPNLCSHRGASLFYGRVEDNGIRCVYHGWLWGTDGRCLDMPSEPGDSNFKDKVRAKTYPTSERGGIVWIYMGPRSAPPPLPDIEPNLLPQEQSAIWSVMRSCNFVQALEGDIDTSHLGFLHFGAIRPEDTPPESMDYYTVKERSPRYEVLDTDYGVMYGAYRPATEDTYYWRIAQFLFPCFTMIPTGELGRQVLVRAWVPIDDYHTMYWSIGIPSTSRASEMPQLNANVGKATANDRPVGTNQAIDYLPNTSDWLGRWRIRPSAENDYFLDRNVQRGGRVSGFEGSYSGIGGIYVQDQAITESMGTILNRSNEHLASSDAMVIRTRHRLLGVANALRHEGTTPPAVDNPELYRTRSGGILLHRDDNWVEGTKEPRSRWLPEQKAIS